MSEKDSGGVYAGKIMMLAKAVATNEDIITDAVDAWLEDNPEATTTVEDGAISYAKLNSSLKESVDDVSSLKSAINSLKGVA